MTRNQLVNPRGPNRRSSAVETSMNSVLDLMRSK